MGALSRRGGHAQGGLSHAGVPTTSSAVRQAKAAYWTKRRGIQFVSRCNCANRRGFIFQDVHFGSRFDSMAFAGALDRVKEDAARVAEAEQAKPLISIVMPCLNEEQTVAVCVRKALAWLKQSEYAGEVIVVDNGSSDRSVELAEAAGARVVHEAQRGYGAALRRGFTEARGGW